MGAANRLNRTVLETRSMRVAPATGTTRPRSFLTGPPNEGGGSYFASENRLSIFLLTVSVWGWHTPLRLQRADLLALSSNSGRTASGGEIQRPVVTSDFLEAVLFTRNVYVYVNSVTYDAIRSN